METLAPSITTYYCTISTECTFSTTKFETWVSHELASHPIHAHDVWLCHRTPSVPECMCNLAFVLRADFEQHWFKTHPKNEVDNWRLLMHDEYLLGPEENRLFWCGFCKRVFNCHMTRNWIVDRFEHVAAHFQTWHATWDHFEIQKWRYLDFWVKPLPVEDVKSNENGNKVVGKEVLEKDGVTIDKDTEQSKDAKEPITDKDTSGAKKPADVEADKNVAADTSNEDTTALKLDKQDTISKTDTIAPAVETSKKTTAVKTRKKAGAVKTGKKATASKTSKAPAGKMEKTVEVTETSEMPKATNKLKIILPKRV